MNPPGVFITGGAIRIGRALALHLAARGHAIAIHYRHSPPDETLAAIRASGVDATAVQADFAQDFDAHALIAQAEAAIGPLGILINSAAIIEKDGVSDLTAERYLRHQRINAYAPLALIQAFAAAAEARGGEGHVINLSDGTFGWSLSGTFLSYALSKLALDNATELLARELAPAIRINSIGLGPTLPNTGETSELFDRHAARSPMQRLNSVEDVCRTVDYLLAAPTVTGQHLYLTGGLHVPFASV